VSAAKATILTRLQRWIKRLRTALAKIATVLKALSYSVAVGGPVVSIAVTITFDPKAATA
jgi:hypothetical protein